MALLMDFNAINIRFEQPKFKSAQNDKHQVYFSIKERDQAVSCYEYFAFNKSKVNIPGSRPQLYYIRPEAVFVKQADIEAEKYYAEEKRQKQEAEARAAAK